MHESRLTKVELSATLTEGSPSSALVLKGWMGFVSLDALKNPMEKSSFKPVQRHIFVSKWFPYFPAFAITLGVLRQMVFYRTFNIRILPFLDFSEIILSFMDILLILLVMALWGIIESKLPSKDEIEEARKKFDELMSEKSEKKKLINFLKIHLSNILFSTIAVCGFYLATLFTFWVPLYFANFVAITAGCLIIFSLLRTLIYLRLDEMDASQEHRDFMHLVVNGVLYLGVVFGVASFEAQMLKNAKEHPVVFIEMNDKTVITTNNTYYVIGRTKDYVFLFSKEHDRTDVIPSKEINALKFYHKVSSLYGN